MIPDPGDSNPRSDGNLQIIKEKESVEIQITLVGSQPRKRTTLYSKAWKRQWENTSLSSPTGHRNLQIIQKDSV